MKHIIFFAVNLCSIALIAQFLSACGEQPAGLITLKLIMHVNAPTVEAIKELNRAFHQKYPNIMVEVALAETNSYPTLQMTRLSAKDVDIVETGALVLAPTPYMPTGFLKPAWQQQVDAGDYINLTGQPFLAHFNASAIQNAETYNGKVWGTPSGSVSYTGVFYSKAIFQRYHLQAPTTWSELISVCQILQVHGITPFTIGQKDGWPAGLPTQALLQALNPNLQALDKGLWTGSRKYTDTNLLEVLQRAQTIWNYAEKGFGGIDYSTITARFAAGKAAMLPDGTWEAPAIRQVDPNFQFGYFPLPGSDKASDNDFLSGKYDIAWSIASSSQQKDAALKWLAFYADPVNYTKFINAVGFIPAQPNISTTPFLQSIAHWTNNLRLSPDQVLHAKTHASKYANVMGYNSLPATTVYLSPLGSYSDPATLAQQMQTDWNAAQS
jgi:raffinose/stachyose/melibiose transport system substrate-binding protein